MITLKLEVKYSIPPCATYQYCTSIISTKAWLRDVSIQNISISICDRRERRPFVVHWRFHMSHSASIPVDFTICLPWKFWEWSQMHHNIQKHAKTMSQNLIKEGGHQRSKKISIERKQKTIISAWIQSQTCLEGTGTLQLGLKMIEVRFRIQTQSTYTRTWSNLPFFAAQHGLAQKNFSWSKAPHFPDSELRFQPCAVLWVRCFKSSSQTQKTPLKTS